MSFSISDTQAPARTNTKGEQVHIDSIRQTIIDGRTYMVCDNSLNNVRLAKDTSLNYLVYSGGSLTHKVKIFIEHDQSVNYRVYELESSLNVRGMNRVMPRNFNRNYADNCAAQVTKAIPAGGISQAQKSGIKIRDKLAFAYQSGTGPLGRTTFGSGVEEYSFITSPTKYYVLSIYNRGPGVCQLGVVIRLSQGTV